VTQPRADQPAAEKLLDPEAMRKAVTASVPKGTEELNLRAFEEGYKYGLNAMGKASTSRPPTLVRAESKTA
jgi:hypothetical protein